MEALVIIVCVIIIIYFFNDIFGSDNLTKKFAHVSINSHIEYENLPLPIVHYPKHGGCFIGFSQTKHDEPYLCTCTEPAVNNYIALSNFFKEVLPEPECISDPLDLAPLGVSDFPDIIAKKSLKYKNDPIKTVIFKPHLCHRCNMATPSVTYLGKNQFQKNYGWYINQNMYHSGFISRYNSYLLLTNVCPKEIQDMIQDFFVGFGCRPRKIRNFVYYSFSRLNDIYPENESSRGKLDRKIWNIFENETRKEFGFNEIGDGWISESVLYQIICQIFQNEEIIRHYRPDWLNGLELDIYIPRLKTGIEYQGQQHFYPIEAWGGEEAFRALQKRDLQKAKICRKRNIILITIDYDDPLTETHIRSLIDAE